MGKYPYFPSVTSEWNKKQKFNSISIKEVTTPTENPDTGYMKLYFKSDGKLYKLNSSGVETVSNSTVSAITQALLDAKANINNPTFTGVVAIPNVANLETAVVANSAKTGITSGQSSAITANTAKTGITSGQASAITANTSKVGITSGQASAITANTSKVGITTSQASAITANTSKVGITSGQASAIVANTAKVSLTDNSVTLAKLAHGTADKVIGFNGSGVPSEITVGGGSEFSTLTTTSTFTPTVQTGNTKVSIDARSLSSGSIDIYIDGSSIKTINTGDYFALVNPSTSLTIQTSDLGYQLTPASYDSKAGTLTIYQSQCEGMSFSPDGTKLYVSNLGNYRIDEGSLSTAWDISTYSMGNNVATTGQPETCFMKPDGTRIFYTSNHNKIFQRTLSTPFNISTAGTEYNYSDSNNSNYIRGMVFSPDGTKILITQVAPQQMKMLSLSTAWDITSTISVLGVYSLASPAPAGSSRALAVNSNGTKYWILNDSTKEVIQFSMSTAWDITSSSLDSTTFGVSSQAQTPRAITFKVGGGKLYVIDINNDKIYQYSTATSYSGTSRISVG